MAAKGRAGRSNACLNKKLAGETSERNTMKIRQCPRCQQQMLISTGAFWTCYACSYAITGHALSVDLGHVPDGARKSKGSRSQ